MTALIIGILGLLIALLGTFMLFKQVTGLREIPMLSEVTNDTHTAFDLYKHAIATVNDSIKDVNERNKTEHFKAKKWMILICLGTVLQITSLLVSQWQTTECADKKCDTRSCLDNTKNTSH